MWQHARIQTASAFASNRSLTSQDSPAFAPDELAIQRMNAGFATQRSAAGPDRAVALLD
jgi:hypothetical protein